MDTRFERIDNGRIIWYNLDLPDVMAQRQQFFLKNPRVHNIAKSLIDERWTKEVKLDGKPLLIISEGVLMYLPIEEVKQFLALLTKDFAEFEVQLDMISAWLLIMQSSTIQ